MTELSHPYKLRVLKTWVARDPSLVFQCQPLGAPGETGFPKKSHLFIDLRQQSFGARLQAEKPTDADANHAFIQILRKNIATFTIKSILHHPPSGDYWMPLLSGPETDRPWLLRLAGSKPPLASLVAPDDTVFVSFGQKGTFTKKHQSDARPSFSGMTDVLPKLMRDLRGDAREETNEDNEVETAAPESAISQLQKDLAGRLKRKLKTSKKTLDKAKGDIPSAEDVLQKEREASLLQSYAWMVKPDAFELQLEPALTSLPETLVISLDPDASVGQNMEKKFAALHKAKRGRELGQKHYDLARDYVTGLEKDLEELQREQKSDAFLQQLVRKYKLPELQNTSSNTSTETGSKPFKTYTASTGHNILVGKSALDNDDLTKAARSNDFWFHAVGVTGSHVIVPVTPDIRQALPTPLLREAAILALHFSRVRDDHAGECYVTRKQYLKKQRGMPAGLWRIDKSESLFFRYSEEEVQNLLQTVRV
ncbi:MAG TPA: NFACT RNA binding domain-containing protein [Oligoflexus sp.]|uniref:NFACT RNA binding domain-containing protein n=1 Tax=Oligoflexus sp. TaxID=1971216 RepID=UPI002D2F2A82|nr:NFACT RNA binding domain-containing protein [Oligoflexus sp.]HYX36129.1 NFACT RNA binding domain-containing protein [Oligoflexus sp.]